MADSAKASPQGWVPGQMKINSLKLKMLSRLVKTLEQPKGNKPKQGNKRNKNKSRRNQVRGMRARNPGTRNRPDNMLSLTRDQFTATSPLNLFTVRSGSSPGGVRVSGRELVNAVTIPITVGTFILSTTFGGTATPSSPIAPISFPRLAAYVSIYEYFKFHKLTYLFQSSQPTTQAGEIIASVDYDPTDAAPTSSSAMMRNISSTMANVYSDASLQVLGSLSRLPKYETTSAFTTENLQQMQGLLYVAAEGYVAAAPIVVGYIVAQYDVEFYTPQ